MNRFTVSRSRFVTFELARWSSSRSTGYVYEARMLFVKNPNRILVKETDANYSLDSNVFGVLGESQSDVEEDGEG